MDCYLPTFTLLLTLNPPLLFLPCSLSPSLSLREGTTTTLSPFPFFRSAWHIVLSSDLTIALVVMLHFPPTLAFLLFPAPDKRSDTPREDSFSLYH